MRMGSLSGPSRFLPRCVLGSLLGIQFKIKNQNVYISVKCSVQTVNQAQDQTEDPGAVRLQQYLLLLIDINIKRNPNHISQGWTTHICIS